MSKTQLIAEPGRQEIIVTRVYDAPRALLFKAHTDPNSVPQWWGPSFLTTAVDKMDVRQGGIWRFVQHDAAGNEYAFHGVYHESLAPERLVYTFEFEGMPGHVLLETITFEAQPDGKTKLTHRSVFQTQEDRDGMLQSGAEAGAEKFDRLAALLAKMQG